MTLDVTLHNDYFKRKIKNVGKNPKAAWSTNGSALTSADVMTEGFDDYFTNIGPRISEGIK